MNKAIRTELVGGEDCLDALHLTHRLTLRLKEKKLPGANEAQKALDALRIVALGMGDEIARRYGMGGGDNA